MNYTEWYTHISECPLSEDELTDAIGEILRDWKIDRDKLQARIFELTGIKSGWNLNNPPRCPLCRITCVPAAGDTGDGWALWWDCANTLCNSEPAELMSRDGYIIPWPFDDEGAYVVWSDLEELGFELRY